MADSRLPSLDGLRALAISLVVYDHVVIWGDYDGLPTFIGLGPRSFFVISGFLITAILLKEQERSGHIWLSRFHFRRALRIIPTVWTYLAVLAVLAAAGLLQTRAADLALAYAFVTDFIHAGSMNVGHTWSLSMQEQFYLLWPSVLAAMGRRRAGVTAGVLIVVTPIVGVAVFHLMRPDPELVYIMDRTPLSNAAALAVGCGLALLRPRLHALTVYRRALASPAWVVAALFVLWGAAGLQNHPTIYYGAWMPLSNLAVAFIVDHAVTEPNRTLGRIANLTPLVSVGTWSYSLYLWQQITLRMPVVMPLRLAGTFVAAWVSYQLVEKQSLALRQRLETRWFPRPVLVAINATGAEAQTEAVVPARAAVGGR